MFAGRDTQVLDALVASGKLARAQLAELSKRNGDAGPSLASLVLDQGWIGRDELLQVIARHVGAEGVVALPAAVSAEMAAQIPAEIAQRYAVVPVGTQDATLEVAVADPFETDLAADLGFALGRPIRVFVADPERVRALRREMSGESAPSAAKVSSEERTSGETAARMVEEPAVVGFVQSVLAQAVRERASDLHFEPFQDEFRVRCRIDGALFDLTAPPRTSAAAVIARLKVLANLNIAERRLPQDGRIRFQSEGRGVDLRVSTLPTQFGESVVLRVLDPSATQRDLKELGMIEELRARVEETIRRPHGIFVVTGPTGSGKTTTLYSCLRLLNVPDAKILTVEDPVEYEIDGVMQAQVNAAAGLTFASALRSFLRHDPDIIMVGEIRDAETAQIAIQAALTGHLVLTTLHTNDACGAVTRLIDMGVEPGLLAATVEAVLAQRLVRCVCPHCREEYTPMAGVTQQVGLSSLEAPVKVFRGSGCQRCHQSGYAGRRGFFELLNVDDGLREMIGRGAAHAELRDAAVARGMRTLRENGLRLLREGVTSLEEFARFN